MKDFITQFKEEFKLFSYLLEIIQASLLMALFLKGKGAFLSFVIITGIVIAINMILENKLAVKVSAGLTVLYIPFYINNLLKIDLGLKIMIYSLAVIFVFSYLKSKEIKMADVINKISLISKINFTKRNKESENNSGDLQVGINKANRQPVILPHKDRFVHSLVLGPTGSGKTSQSLIPWLEQDIKNPSMGITVVEPKGDLAEKIYAMAQVYGRKTIYFNPILKACPTFNPLYGPEDDVIEDMVTTFKMLNADSSTYFQNMNEQLLRNSLKLLKRLKTTPTLLDLNDVVSNAGGKGRALVAHFEVYNKERVDEEDVKRENEEIIDYFRGNYYQ